MLFDSVWVVSVDEEQLIQRLMQRDGLSREAVQGHLDAQWPQAQKVAQADVVIDNSGSIAETEAQVIHYLGQLKAHQEC